MKLKFILFSPWLLKSPVKAKVDSRVWGVSEISTTGLLLFMRLSYRVPLTGSVRALQASTGKKPY